VDARDKPGHDGKRTNKKKNNKKQKQKSKNKLIDQ
jgi:hypothetical protein